MATYKSGNRIVGTSAERTSTFVPSSPHWVELGRTTTSSALSDFNVSSLANKPYLMVLTNITGRETDGINWQTRMGNGSIDTGSNYAFRYSLNGGSDSVVTSQSYIQTGTNPTDNPSFSVAFISNKSDQEKLYLSHDVNQESSGAGNATKRGEYTGKWANTSNPIDVIGATTSSSYTMSSGSEMVVLGYDPDDTSGTNFWEELASSNTVSSNAIEVSFTAKKYLWIQGTYKQGSGTSGSMRLQVGNSSVDTGSNYSYRASEDGATDATSTSQSDLKNLVTDGSGAVNFNGFFNIFVINKSDKEKLMISEFTTDLATTGAGTAPRRVESVGKWANTSAQIDIVKLFRSSDTLTSGSLKVWGAD